MPISEDLKKVYSTAPVDDYYVETLSLDHPAFTLGKRYLCNQIGGWTGFLETGGFVGYEYLPFTAVPPSSADQAAINLQVGIDNASRVLMQELESVAEFPSEPIEVVYRVYLASDPNTLQNDPPLKLYVSSVLANTNIISFSASLTNIRNLPFPSELYTTDFFPGLAR